jgi:hypothetical protein
MPSVRPFFRWELLLLSCLLRYDVLLGWEGPMGSGRIPTRPITVLVQPKALYILYKNYIILYSVSSSGNFFCVKRSGVTTEAGSRDPGRDATSDVRHGGPNLCASPTPNLHALAFAVAAACTNPSWYDHQQQVRPA